MDTVTAKTPSQASNTSGLARITGRVEHSRTISTQNGAVRLTLLKLPAADEFAYPSTIEVQSRQPLGAKGENVTVIVRIGGRARTYDTKPDEQGQTFRVPTATNTLESTDA